MEKIFIDREWCLNYVLLALESVINSANKERTIEEFIDEIQLMFEIYIDESQMKNVKKRILESYGKKKITIQNGLN